MPKHHKPSKQQIEKFIVENIYHQIYTKPTGTGRKVHSASKQQIVRYIMDEILSKEYENDYKFNSDDTELIKDWYEKNS